MAHLLHQTFETQVRRIPDKTALVREGRRSSYADIDALSAALAASLRAQGIGRGDRVALFLDNSEHMVAALYAVLRIGAVFMPVNTLTKADKLAYVLADAEAAALVTQHALAEVARQALALAPGVRNCWLADDGYPAPAQALPGQLAYPQAAEGAQARAPDEGATIDQDLAAILYTSGSTGRPKGVMLSHRNMLSALGSVSGYLGLHEHDVITCALPLAFDYGLYQVLMAFALGATVLLERSFTYPARVLQDMAREGATVFAGVPTMFAMLLGMDLSSFDLRSLRLVTNTAAALPVPHIRRIRDAFPLATLFSMYGLTECKRVSYLPPEQLDIRPQSVGRGMPNEELWLVDEQGRRLPHGSTGELVVRGSHVMRGYWKQPQASAERLRPGPLPGEMVLYTGDVFRSDEEGWLYFVARKDDIIKSRGEKVSPREVENVLHELAGVQQAAVVGVPDELLGEAIKAFVVLAPGQVLDQRAVLRHCQARLESFMVPRQVEFVPELPQTDNGKVRRASLL
ncbi:MAG: AMP-binding protein [Betaproteobacteria bacterium]|nr:AMP-binding protein [Betaproteobacteria bacterium]